MFLRVASSLCAVSYNFDTFTEQLGSNKDFNGIGQPGRTRSTRVYPDYTTGFGPTRVQSGRSGGRPGPTQFDPSRPFPFDIPLQPNQESSKTTRQNIK
jgi:hypothetical protein